MARNRPWPSALNHSQIALQAIGLQPGGPLALAVTAIGAWQSKSIDHPATHIVIGATAGDAEHLVADAISAGARVMVEDALAALDWPVSVLLDQVVAPFTFRFEPAVASARDVLQGGSLGLPFAVTAEAVGQLGTNSAFVAYDLLDATLFMTGLSVRATCTVSVNPFVMSHALSHGVIGDTSALAIPSGESLAIVCVRGSHGSLQVNLCAPQVLAVSSQLHFQRLGESGARRLIERFCSGAALPTLADLASLVSSTRYPR